MKTKVLSLLVLSAFAAGAAQASDITVYGVVNTGFSYMHSEAEVGNSADSFVMDSGNYLGSRLGVKGEEQLATGTRVGFVLENGFSSDTGTLSDGERLFGREASLYIRNDAFGTLRFGRMTPLVGSTGTSGLMAGKFSATSTGWGVMYGHNAAFAINVGRIDNVVMYSTPKFAGLQLHAQYSSGTDQKNESTGVENKGSTTRYMGFGAQYFSGPLSSILVVDSTHYANTQDDPSLTANLSVAYDFTTLKVFVTGQYFEDMRNLGKATVNSQIAGANVFGTNVAKDGYAMNFGVTAPVSNGKIYAAVSYMNAEASADSTKSMKRCVASAGYDYALSKRTKLYAGAGYMIDKYDDFGADIAASNDDAAAYGVTFGLSHSF